MGNMILVRASSPSDAWGRLCTSWGRQVKKHGASIDWAEPSLIHATDIIEGRHNGDGDYGIFIVCGGTEQSPKAPYEGFIHISFKLIGTPKAEIKLLWNRIAPKYQFEDLKYEVADVLAEFIFGALTISENDYNKIPVKMFLGNPIEQAFGRNFALFMNKIAGTGVKASVRSNWLFLKFE